MTQTTACHRLFLCAPKPLGYNFSIVEQLISEIVELGDGSHGSRSNGFVESRVEVDSTEKGAFVYKRRAASMVQPTYKKYALFLPSSHARFDVSASSHPRLSFSDLARER